MTRARWQGRTSRLISGPMYGSPAAHPAAPGRVIGLGELARMDVIHGPRRELQQVLFDTADGITM